MGRGRVAVVGERVVEALVEAVGGDAPLEDAVEQRLLAFGLTSVKKFRPSVAAVGMFDSSDSYRLYIWTRPASSTLTTPNVQQSAWARVIVPAWSVTSAGTNGPDGAVGCVSDMGVGPFVRTCAVDGRRSTNVTPACVHAGLNGVPDRRSPLGLPNVPFSPA